MKSACNDEDEYRLLSDNPASMFDIARQILEKMNFPIFLILESADDLFSNLYDAATILCRRVSNTDSCA